MWGSEWFSAEPRCSCAAIASVGTREVTEVSPTSVFALISIGPSSTSNSGALDGGRLRSDCSRNCLPHLGLFDPVAVFSFPRPSNSLSSLGTTDKSLPFRNISGLLFACYVPAQCLGESFHSQKALCLQIFPNGGAVDSFRYVAPVFLLSGAAPLAKIGEDLIHCQTAGDIASPPLPDNCSRSTAGDGRPPCSYGIEHHVAADFEKMALFLNQDSFKPPLNRCPTRWWLG